MNSIAIKEGTIVYITVDAAEFPPGQPMSTPEAAAQMVVCLNRMQYHVPQPDVVLCYRVVEHLCQGALAGCEVMHNIMNHTYEFCLMFSSPVPPAEGSAQRLDAVSLWVPESHLPLSMLSELSPSRESVTIMVEDLLRDSVKKEELAPLQVLLAALQGKEPVEIFARVSDALAQRRRFNIRYYLPLRAGETDETPRVLTPSLPWARLRAIRGIK